MTIASSLSSDRNDIPFESFLAAHCVFGLLEKDIERGLFSKFAYFYRKSLLSGTKIQQTNMNNCPDMISGVNFCKSQSKFDLWAFGLIVGAEGENSNLLMVTCCGEKRAAGMINILRPFEIIDGKVRYRSSPQFVRVNEKLEGSPASEDETKQWAKNFEPK